MIKFGNMMDIIRTRSRRNSVADETLSRLSTGTKVDQDHHHHQQEPPPWDRIVDIVCHKYKQGEKHPTPADAFDAAAEDFPSEIGFKRHSSATTTKQGYYARLPASVRFKICQYVIPVPTNTTTTTITLSRHTFTKDVWPHGSLTTLSTALAPIQPLLSVSSSFRNDVLLAFLCTSTFHVVFSPYVNTHLSPLATLWLRKYGSYIKQLILEIDMTKLGLGYNVDAAYLLPGLSNMERLLELFVDSQGNRKAPMELILLCRRFYGWRDVITTPSPPRIEPRASAETPPDRLGLSRKRSIRSQKESRTARVSLESSYSTTNNNNNYTTTTSSSCSYSSPSSPPIISLHCPEYHLEICNHLLRLRGYILSLRMCGFGERYTHDFIQEMFPSKEELNAYRVAPSGAWIKMKGQKAWIDAGHGNIVLDDHNDDDAKLRPFFSSCQGKLQGPCMPPRPIRQADGSVSIPGYVPPGSLSSGSPERAKRRRRTITRQGQHFPRRSLVNGSNIILLGGNLLSSSLEKQQQTTTMTMTMTNVQGGERSGMMVKLLGKEDMAKEMRTRVLSMQAMML